MLEIVIKFFLFLLSILRELFDVFRIFLISVIEIKEERFFKEFVLGVVKYC